MKFRSFFLNALCLFSAGCFTSCRDDEEGDAITTGIFILDEGSYQRNNAVFLK